MEHTIIANRSDTTVQMNSRNNIRNGERDKSSSQSRSSSHPPQQRLLNFNSARTARILALLLLLTLITQAILIAYHDDFVLELNSLEGDLLEDMSAVNSAATDAINAAYEYNDGGSVGGTAAVVHQHHQKEIITNISSSIFSMEPIDILKRAGVDHTAGFVPSITGREAREAKKIITEAVRFAATRGIASTRRYSIHVWKPFVCTWAGPMPRI